MPEISWTGGDVVALIGQRLRRGGLVLAIVGASDRDPHRFSDPDTFDIRGRDGARLSFGCGAHVCVASRLAMLEAEVAVPALMRRWPALAMALAPALWNGNAGLLGLMRLMRGTCGKLQLSCNRSDRGC